VIRLATVCCKGLAAGLLALAVLGAAGGCGGSDEATPKEVVLVTHDSFAVSKAVKAAFEKESGMTLRVLQAGDAGEALNRALLTAGDPQGDVFFGVDDSYLSRAIDGDVFDAYRSPELDAVDTAYAPPDDEVTPIDHGEVCLNVDRGWFAQRGLAPPRTLEELTLERYRNLLVVENPATSSPGLAFLLATVARYGDKWQGYWRKLKANGVKVVDGWEAAYTQQFSGAADSPGKRPIVVSYATSPAAEVIFSGKPLTRSPTAAIADGCYRQVEYAAILRGARNEGSAKKLIDFMLSERFQSDVPGSMFVYPVRDGVRLPDAFEKFAIQPSAPLQLTSEQIEAGRDTWIEQWTQTVLR
jgi:thiamine transport system substrate-binding protein